MRSNIRRKKYRQHRKRSRRSVAVLILLLLVWSICLGWGLALITNATVTPNSIAQSSPAKIGTLDPVPARYQLGQELYLENCGSCHVALPPEVMPTETWRRLLQEPDQHYGQQLQPLIGPSVVLMWNYLQTYSRPFAEGEPIPYRVSESRFFKALHPQVDLPQSVKPGSCVSCHPGVAQFDYRSLTAEWENSP